MKKYFSALLLLCLTTLLPAQDALEDNDIAQNWTLTDINGQSYTLYDYLNQDKAVVLYFFDASVMPCWTYQQTQALQDLEAQYGANGKDSVRVFYIEANLTTSDNNIHGNLDAGQAAWMVTGDYTLNNPAPIINLTGANSQIFTDYRLTDYPLVVTVCPERIIKIAGLRTMAQHVEFFSDSLVCQRQCNCPKDMAVAKYYGPRTTCADHVFYPKLMVQNLGQDTIHYFKVKVDYYGTSYAPGTPFFNKVDSAFNVNLAPFDTMLITLNTYFLHDIGLMKIYTLLVPGNADQRPGNSTTYYGISLPPNIYETDTNVVFKLNTDQYGEEIIWNMSRSNGDILLSGGPYPNLPDTGITEHIFPLHLEQGECYKITIFDTFGDGICCDNGNGSYQLMDSDGTIILEGGANFLEEKIQFRAHYPGYTYFGTGVAQELSEKVAIYPNPAQSDLIIDLDHQPKYFVAKMIDINGRLVKTWESDKAKQFIDISELNAGMYLLHLSFDGTSYSQKIAVIR